MSALPNPFLANDESGSPETNFRASLDLSGAPAGSYYFNKENNFNYTKNWFNYSKFDVIEQDSVINEIAQYSSVPIEVGELDSNKVYQLPSTTMTPQWITRITYTPGQRSPGYSGVDLAGNTYLCTLYGFSAVAQGFDSNNNLGFTESYSGFQSNICLGKFNAAGSIIWSIRIVAPSNDTSLELLYCVTDNQGNTFIAGRNNISGNVVFENASGTAVFTVPIPGVGGFLVAYNSSGTPDWVTKTDRPIQALAVDNQAIGNVYGVIPKGGSFYDPNIINPVLTVPSDADLVVAKWRSTSGLFQWASYLTGYRVFLYGRIFNPGFSAQCIACDLNGSVYVTGYYTQFSSVYEGRTPADSAWVSSSITLPPFSNPVVWTPREQDRNWSAVTLSDSGQYMYATVQNGLIYSSSNFGATWTARATIQEWSSIWCTDTGQYVVATVTDSVIYVSGDYGTSWSIALGEGGNARAWISVSGNSDGSIVVACAKDDAIYYSLNQGSLWSASTAPVKNWKDVAFGRAFGFVAIIPQDNAYKSTNGITWSAIATTPVSQNWSAISGQRISTSIFFATVDGGVVYGLNGSTWTIVNSSVQTWVDVACNANTTFAVTFDGAIYQATYSTSGAAVIVEEWTPTTIPRNWNRIAMVENYAIASVLGGQLYTSTSFYPVRHTFILKYNPEGIVQWGNYVNCPSTNETDNSGVCVTTQSNGNVIVSGQAGNTNQFFTPINFEVPVKVLVTDSSLNGVYRYIACYSSEGTPLWVNSIRMLSDVDPGDTPDDTNEIVAMCVDELDNIYCIGNAASAYFYNPLGQLVFQDATQFYGKAILVKYYPDGFFQSYALLTFQDRDLNGTSIRALGQGTVYISGCAQTSNTTPVVLNAYAQVGGAVVKSVSTPQCVFASKYSSLALSWFTIPNPGYNLVFQPQFSIGGSTRYLVDGYTGDGAIELWGGKTGLLPSAIDTADLNASVISYLGHQPGYTIPVVEGLQTFSPKVYSHLVVGLSEPSFPTMDPQPVTPGTIPYGFLPIYAVLPTYTTGLVLNNSLNDNTSAILSTTGTVSNDALMILGLYVGDKVRILLFTSATAQYVTLTVAGFIDSETVGNVQAAVRFEESTRYVCKMLGSTTNATASLIVTGTARYAPMFWQPVLVQEGTLNIVVQLYPQSIS